LEDNVTQEINSSMRDNSYHDTLNEQNEADELNTTQEITHPPYPTFQI